jgi:hypothetical protein
MEPLIPCSLESKNQDLIVLSWYNLASIYLLLSNIYILFLWFINTGEGSRCCANRILIGEGILPLTM